MRAYPILYLTLAIICGAGVGFGIVGAVTADPTLPPNLNQAGFYLGWVPIAIGVFSIFSLVFWVIGLVHCLTNKALQGNDKLVWILVVILLNALGAVLYFFLAPDPGLSSVAATK
jgi:uncharacterized membrane protein